MRALQPDNLLACARDLLKSRSGRPKQENLRRAVSTVYYALFHQLAQSNADLMVGTTSASRSNPAWKQAYRALEHKDAKNRCKDARGKAFPPEIIDFANLFVSMQEKRHQADYDPGAGLFVKSSVLLDIENAQEAIRQFKSTPVTDRRAFAVQVLFKVR